MHQAGHEVHAEYLHVPERLILAPVAGRFRGLAATILTGEGQGAVLERGQAIGVVERMSDEVTVVSAHHGWLMGILALPGERVREHQPVAWVRVCE